MKKMFTVFLVAISGVVLGQKLITKNGTIDILSETSIFKIEAQNQKVASVLNTENGDLVASTLVRSFDFHEALVEEHFNENYMESHKFPKAVFTGKIDNIKEVDFKKDGTYKIKISGTLTMHGETNQIAEMGEIKIENGNIVATSVFIISLEAYKIKIEESYKDRIQDKIRLTVNFKYLPYEQK